MIAILVRRRPFDATAYLIQVPLPYVWWVRYPPDSLARQLLGAAQTTKHRDGHETCARAEFPYQY